MCKLARELWAREKNELCDAVAGGFWAAFCGLGFGSRVIWLTGVFYGSRAFCTNMSSELFVALELIMHLHLVDGFSNERP
jgi:hypothetical protein